MHWLFFAYAAYALFGLTSLSHADSIEIHEGALQHSCELRGEACTPEIYERIRTQAQVEAERVFAQDWSAEALAQVLEQTQSDAQPLPEEIVAFFTAQDPENAELLSHVGWISRSKAELQDERAIHAGELLTDRLIYGRTWVTWVASESGIALPIIAAVRAPDRMREALSKLPFRVVFAVRDDLDPTHARLTRVHETQHAIDFLKAEALSPQHWHSLKQAPPQWPVPLLSEQENLNWSTLEQSAKGCPTFEHFREELQDDFVDAQAILPELYFTPIEISALRAEALFAKNVMGLSSEEFVEHVRPQNTTDIRKWVSQVQGGAACPLTDASAQETVLVPSAFEESLKKLFEVQKSDL